MRRSKHSKVLTVLYVVDLLIAVFDEVDVTVVIQFLQKKFEISKAEIAEEFLGTCFEYLNDHLFLSQKTYVEKV